MFRNVFTVPKRYLAVDILEGKGGSPPQVRPGLEYPGMRPSLRDLRGTEGPAVAFGLEPGIARGYGTWGSPVARRWWRSVVAFGCESSWTSKPRC